MKLAYDISGLRSGYVNPQQRRGVDRVVEEIGRSLLTIAQDARSNLEVVLTSVASSGFVEEYLPLQVDEVYRTAPSFSKPLHRYWTSLEHRALMFLSDVEDRSLIKRLSRRAVFHTLPWVNKVTDRLRAFDLEAIDVYHNTAISALPAYLLDARTPACFLTLYDLIPFRHPSLAGPFAVNNLRRTLAGFNRKHFGICISQHVKDEVCELLPVDPSHLFVAPLAADASRFYPCADAEQIGAVKERYGLPTDDQPYLLTLSALEQRKNLLHLVRCFAQLRREDPTSHGLRLVLVGQMNKLYSKEFDSLIAQEHLEGHVVLTGYVADGDLAALYSGALAFVFPSLAEGFGLPPLEAMQCGLPVISSDRTSLPEVVGDAGLLVDPEDGDALCEAMHRVLHDEALRTDLSARSLARSAQFSWTRCAEDHLHAYRTAVKLKQ